MVVHHLVVSQRARIRKHLVYPHVSTVRAYADTLRSVLLEVVVILIAHRRHAVTVHIQLHERAVGTLAHVEGKAHTLALRIVLLHAHRRLRHDRQTRLRVSVLLVLLVLRRAAVEHGAVRRNAEALRIVLHAVHHHRAAVRHVVHLHVYLYRHASALHVLHKRLKVNHCLRTVLQHQSLAVPAARLPVHALKGRTMFTVGPQLSCLRAFRVRASRSVQLQLQPLRRLAYVQTARHHIHNRLQRSLAALQLQPRLALLHEAPHIRLPSAAHAVCLLRLLASGRSLRLRHHRRNLRRVVCRILKLQPLILLRRQTRPQRHLPKHHLSVLVYIFHAHPRASLAALQQVYPYRVRLQTISLRNQLHRVSACRQRIGGNRERIASRACLAHVLGRRHTIAVNIHRHRSVPRASQSERDAYRLPVLIAALLHRCAHVIVRRQFYAHHRHHRIGLLSLLLALSGRTFSPHIHIHISRHRHICREVCRISAPRHVAQLLRPERRSAQFHADAHRCVHTVALVLSVHMVVSPGQLRRAALFHKLRSHLCRHQYAACRRCAATAATHR